MDKSIFEKNLLAEKKIMVTGSNSGIGKYTSDLLLAHGAKLIKTSRKFTTINKKEIINNPEIIYIEKDLTDENAAYGIFSEIPKDWLPIDGIFHSAGKEYLSPLSLVNEKDINNSIKTSLNNALLFGKAATKKKYINDSASIVFLSSVSSKIATPGMSIYGSVKSSLNTSTKYLACELYKRKIRVNTIIAGAIQTPMHERIISKIPESARIDYQKKHLLGFGDPIEIANMVLFLLSKGSKWITGSEIYVDGGYSCSK